MTSVCRTLRSGRAGSAVAAWPAVGWAAVGLFALITDAVTKDWAVSALRGGHVITAPGGVVRLQLVFNHGAAFGIGSGHEAIVFFVSLALVAALAVWVVRAGTAVERIGAWLAVGGGLGNVLDRLFRAPGGLHGAVVDWIHLSFYGPTFNLADVWLRGGLLLAVAGWLWSRRKRPGAQANEERTSLCR